MAFPLGEDRDQHVGAGHLLAAGGLHVDMGALDDALETGGRLGVVVAFRDEVFEFLVDVLDEVLLQDLDVDRAGLHHGARVAVVGQREKQMLERRIFVMAIVGDRQCAVEGLFERAGECGHWGSGLTSFP